MKVCKNLLGESEIAFELSEVDGEDLQSTKRPEQGGEGRMIASCNKYFLEKANFDDLMHSQSAPIHETFNIIKIIC